MNNLYGHAMSQYLPYANFKWVKNIDKIKQRLMGIQKNSSVKKLVPNLMNKNNYVIHYRNLQQCLELGMKLKKMHRVLKVKTFLLLKQQEFI